MVCPGILTPTVAIISDDNWDLLHPCLSSTQLQLDGIFIQGAGVQAVETFTQASGLTCPVASWKGHLSEHLKTIGLVLTNAQLGKQHFQRLTSSHVPVVLSSIGFRALGDG